MARYEKHREQQRADDSVNWRSNRQVYQTRLKFFCPIFMTGPVWYQVSLGPIVLFPNNLKIYDKCYRNNLTLKASSDFFSKLVN